MIEPIKEDLIKELFKQGMSKRAIAKHLKISRTTINKVISNPETRPSPNKSSKYDPYIDQVREYFNECKGNVVRVQEKLFSQNNISIPYQSLTWLIRKYQLRSPVTKRAGRYHFEPGEEMQHDTSPHKITIGNKQVTAQCASLVLAYSRKIFIQYYPRFTRFECKVFLAEALQYMQGSCKRCVIDNTSVIVGRGSGPDAVMAPEMEMFARIYGAHFMAHRIMHADRKARVERPFYYAETNFLVGRTFSGWHDLNQQARDWCDQVANRKTKRILGMSPDEAWVMEKHSLLSLPRVPPPVYVSFQRTVDVEGYVHLDTIRYSVPDTLIGENVEVLKHWGRVEVYHGRILVAKHKRVLQGRHKRVTEPKHHRPLTRTNAHQGPSAEEVCLTGRNKTLDCYVAELKKRSRGRGVVRLRQLLELKRTYPSEPFMAAIDNALCYGLFDLARLERIILKNTGGDFFEIK